jgi:hypothetical protein
MTEPARPVVKRTGLRHWQHGAIFLLACAVIVLRRPDAVFNAQFWNEDGRVFFADAYNFGGWAALFRSYEGYLHALPRLGASLALLVPLSFAPLVMNLIAIGVQALPASILFLSRSSAWGSLRYRALLAGIYLVLPNCWEINANITNSQWTMALCVFLLLVASRPRGAGERCFDLSMVSLCGLTGPICIFLLPIALFLAWRDRDRWRWLVAGILAAACFVQGWTLFNGGFASRPRYALGVSPVMLARILGGQVYFGTLLGSNGLASHSAFSYSAVLTGMAICGTIFVLVCFFRLPLEMKLLFVFSALIFAAALISPTLGTHPGITAWEILGRAGGARYWFLPTLACAWLLLWCVQSRSAVLKAVSATLLCIMCFGFVRDWRFQAFRDMHFAEYASRLESAPAGTEVIIPQSTEGWYMTLVKRPPGR